MISVDQAILNHVWPAQQKSYVLLIDFGAGCHGAGSSHPSFT